MEYLTLKFSIQNDTNSVIVEVIFLLYATGILRRRIVVVKIKYINGYCSIQCRIIFTFFKLTK